VAGPRPGRRTRSLTSLGPGSGWDDSSRGDRLPTAREVGRYFDGLYAAVGSSPTHAALSREALGNGYVGQLGYASEEDLQLLSERVGAGPGSRILDLCCGTAGVAASIGRMTGAEVIGVDCSLVGLRLARVQHVDLSNVAGDVSRLPFADRSFDGIVCLDGFSYTPGAMAWEAIRVLRPGGRLVFLVSLPGEGVGEMASSLREVGFTDVRSEERSTVSEPLMAGWLASFERHAAQHAIEVGARYHESLAGEIRRLLDGYRAGTAVRVLLDAERPRVPGAD
jgi:SAM-dependent methyltransferase